MNTIGGAHTGFDSGMINIDIGNNNAKADISGNFGEFSEDEYFHGFGNAGGVLTSGNANNDGNGNDRASDCVGANGGTKRTVMLMVLF